VSYARQNNVGGTELPKANFGKFYIVNSSAATFQAIGSTVNTAGTLANDNNETTFVSATTAAVTGSNAGINSGAVALVSHLPTMTVVFKTGANITNLRYWIGLFAGSTTNTDDVATQNVAFRFSAVAGDTGWVPQTRNATTQTLGTTIGTVAANTVYTLRIRWATTSNVAFSVNGSPEQYMTAALPTSASSQILQVQVWTNVNTAKSISISRAVVDMK